MPDTEPPHSASLRSGRYSEVFGLYFVTKCLRNGEQFTDVQKTHVVDAFSFYSEKESWLPHAFVVMPDHWHALFSLGESTSLSRFMETIGRRISFPTRQAGLAEIPWQPGFHDHKIRPGESIKDVVDYIESNPVRKGLCETNEKWGWSSKNPNSLVRLHRDFLGHERWKEKGQS